VTDPHFVPQRSPVAGAGDTIVLTGADLTIGDVEAVARRGTIAALDVHARARMQEAREVIERLVAEGAVVYGVTTGFGALAERSIDAADVERLQENLLVSHAVGVGEPLPRDVVRAMLLLRANTLALGHSGARPLVVDRLLDFLRLGVHPVVPAQGSVGASGDLAPLAHLALPLIGRGTVELNGQVVPAMVAHREVGLEPLTLGSKEGLALLNGTQLMSALGALLLVDADRLVRSASTVAAMSVEALLGTDVAFAAAYQLARPHPGQVEVAAELRNLLRESGLQASHHGSHHKVQDPYSLRCVPQVHGAVRDALDHLRRVLDIELNSATDNPLVFPGGGGADAAALATGGGLVISGGNFHGEPIALALDFAKLALAELGSISERRTALLLDPHLNGGLPAFLAPASGLDSGLMLLAVHGGRPRLGEQGADPSGLVRFDPDEREPGGPRLDGPDRGPPRPGGPGACRDDPRHRGALRGAGPRPAVVRPPGVAPGVGVREAHACVRAAARHLDADRELGPDLAATTAIVRAGALASLAAAARTGA
jgi:histidine ammonia-lyase